MFVFFVHVKSFQMRKIILIELLEKIEKTEYVILRGFIAAPYWKLKKEDLSLFDDLVKRPNKMVSKYHQYAEQHPKSIGHQKERLVKVIEHYLLLKYQQQYPFYKDLNLLGFFNANQMTKNYKAKLKQFQKHFKNHSVDNEQNFFKFKIYEMMAVHAKHERKEMPELTMMLTALDHFYQENRARLYCEFSSQKEIINAHYDSVKEQLAGEGDTLTEIYQHIDQLHNSNNHKAYYLFLKETALTNQLNLAPDIIHTIYNHLLNYCAKYINQGSIALAKEYLELIHSLINKKMLLDNKILDYGRYTNIIAAYLIAGKNVSEVMAFINTYTTYLKASDNRYTEALNCSRVYLWHNDYKKAENYLLTISNKYSQLNWNHKILFKKLELQLAYLNGEDLVFTSCLKNFRSLIANKDELKGGKKLDVLRGFANCIDRLLKDKLTSTFLEEQILAATDKHWLKTKL